MLYCCRWIGSILLFAHKGKDSTCQTENRKTKRKEGEVAFITVVADIGGGE
jgi:hypothetical protein